jgi:hypothetical protein
VAEPGGEFAAAEEATTVRDSVLTVRRSVSG